MLNVHLQTFEIYCSSSKPIDDLNPSPQFSLIKRI